jgi:hypothetical protein
MQSNAGVGRTADLAGAIAVGCTAASAAAALVVACTAFAPATRGGVVPLAAACACLFAAAFAPLALGEPFARRKLRTAMLVWPLFGFGAAAFASAASNGVRCGLAVSLVASVAAYVAFRASALPGSRRGPPVRERRPLATIDRDTLAGLQASGASARTSVVAAAAGWVLLAQVGLVGLFACGTLAFAEVGALRPAAGDPGNVAAALVVFAAYVRAYYYALGRFSYEPNPGTRRAVLTLFGITLALLVALGIAQVALLLPAFHARPHDETKPGLDVIVALVTLGTLALDGFALSRVRTLDVERLASRGYRVGDA